MAKENEQATSDELWERYFAMQLTPEQKAEARARMRDKADEAARNGFYQDLLAMRGKVTWPVSWEELRDEE
ncbi:MAG: hypothetical protein QOH21_2695 [Acidobacteriota bacterium]|nr:hypothetical protein [Acidobacteriota bacterium]